MQNPNSTPSNTNHRVENRISVPGLTASIRQQGLISPIKFYSCEVSDINRGGIGVVSDINFLKDLRRAVLLLSYQGHHFCIRGIVVYRSTRDKKMYAGIMFVHVPYQFDHLIEQWLKLPLANICIKPEQENADIKLPTEIQQNTIEEQVVSGTQRRIDARFELTDITIRAKKSNLLNLYKYVFCTVQNVSRGGISFVSELLKQKLLGKVTVELDYKGQSFRFEGIVLYFHSTDSGCHYGVEFTSIPPKWVNFVDSTKEKS